jgi:hypothetical protein
MRARLIVSLLLAASLGASGCRGDLFSDCDRRPSLADWFDCYGPTGCYCRDGRCPIGYCTTCGNHCSHGESSCGCSSR